MNTILSLSKVKSAMYGSSVFQNFYLGRQQVYLITECLHKSTPGTFKPVCVFFAWVLTYTKFYFNKQHQTHV
jgi:hypothetical protein